MISSNKCKKKTAYCGKITVNNLETPVTESFMIILNTVSLESNRQIRTNFHVGDLFSDTYILLLKEFVSKLGIEILLFYINLYNELLKFFSNHANTIV